LVLGFLHGVRGEFTADISETAVGSSFTDLASEDGCDEILKITHESILRRVRKIAKLTINCVMSVRPEQLGSYWTDFYEI
jgi:hypothetical protein